MSPDRPGSRWRPSWLLSSGRRWTKTLWSRAEVASALGEADDRAKALVDDDGARLAAAYDALRRQPAARRSFPAEAFAARDRSIRERSVAHKEHWQKLFPSQDRGTRHLGKLGHTAGTLLRVVVSLPADARRAVSGRSAGDADQPDQDWILPNDAGHVSPGVIAEIEALVQGTVRACC